MAEMRLASTLFALLILFFFGSSTGQQTSFDEVLTLLELRHDLGIRAYEWPIKKDPCSEWEGIRCKNGSVTEINISGFKRTRIGKQNPGFKVDALVNLTNLISFNASRFGLPGSIPTWFGNRISKLQELDLSSCSIIGPVPASFGNLTNMRVMNLSDNSLNGSIPSNLQKLSSLSILDLSRNDFIGSIPSSFGSLTNLSSLSMSFNFLDGPIPLAIGTLKKLKKLHLSNNNLSSSIPPQLGDLHSLVELDLSSNALSGSIPSDLNTLRNLHTLNFGDNMLSGSLHPDVFPVPSKLKDVVLKDNNLSGTIPDVVWMLPELRNLDLSSNNFTDKLPNTDVSSNTTSSKLNVSGNMLYGPITQLLKRFRSIDLSDNYLEGPIPDYVPKNASLDENCLRGAPNQRGDEECSTFYFGIGRRFETPAPPPSSSASAITFTKLGWTTNIILAVVAGGIGSTLFLT